MSEQRSRLKRLLSDSTGFIKEVLMIIVGISIALWVDKWQQQVKNENELVNIYAMLEADLQDDTTDVADILRDYIAEAEIYGKMLNNVYSKEELMVCDSCQQLMTGYPFLIFETKGFQALKNFSYDTQADTLPNYIISALTAFHDAKDIYHSDIAKDSEENTRHWRDNYDWFTDFYLDQPNEDFIDFLLNSPKHKNRLSYHASLIYDNFLPYLELTLEEYTMILKALDAKLTAHGISREERSED